MNICPNCSAMIPDDGDSICLECGYIFDELNDSNYKEYPWILIYTTNTEIDALMFKANLESAGIPVRILSQLDTTRMFTVGELAIVKIFVPSTFEKDAKMIIDSIESHSKDED